MADLKLHPCRQCGEPTSKPMYCRRACKITAWRRRNPDRNTSHRKVEAARKRDKCRAIVKLCGCGKELPFRRRTCDDCKRATCRRLSRLHSERKHNKAPRRCLECGTTFEPRYGTKLRSYCSPVCRHKAGKRTARIRRKAKQRAVTVEPVNPTKVFVRDGWRCHLCGRSTDKTKRGSTHPNAPELDHIVPLGKGGEHSYRNTACAHRRCNAEKSDTIIGQPSLLTA